jgi:hypothetical protein
LNDYFVVVDFCDDIELVRESLLEAGIGTWLPNKGAVGSSVYEGMGFWGDHVYMLRSLVAATGSVILPNAMFFRVTNVGMEKAYIHSDRGTGAHSCIAYLSEHENGTSGTAFYKHIPTGLLEMPSFEEMHEMGIFDELSADMVGRDPDKWEQVDFVEGKYNRALIFKAPLFHSRFPLDGIGDNETNVRLIWASHFYKLNGYGGLF